MAIAILFFKVCGIILVIAILVGLGMAASNTQYGVGKSGESEDNADAAKPKETEDGKTKTQLLKEKYAKPFWFLLIGVELCLLSPYWTSFVWHTFGILPFVLYLAAGAASTTLNVDKPWSEDGGRKMLYTIAGGIIPLIFLINGMFYAYEGQEDNFLMWGYTYEKGKSQHQTIIDQTPKYEKYRKSQAIAQQPAEVQSESDWTVVALDQSGKKVNRIKKGQTLHIRKGSFPIKVSGLDQEIKAETREVNVYYQGDSDLRFTFSGKEISYKIS
ncbi:MAG: hypothetical protein ABH884_01130 [Candidatus Komeilibacteria bacterium]